jgi:hypothetical protein
MTQNSEKWGRAAAKSRYGSVHGGSKAEDQHQPQDAVDKHGANYDNDVTGWAHNGGDSHPNFDKKGK